MNADPHSSPEGVLAMNCMRVVNQVVVGVAAAVLASATRRSKIRKLEGTRKDARQRIEKLRYSVTQIRMDPERALESDDLKPQPQPQQQ